MDWILNYIKITLLILPMLCFASDSEYNKNIDSIRDQIRTKTIKTNKTSFTFFKGLGSVNYMEKLKCAFEISKVNMNKEGLYNKELDLLFFAGFDTQNNFGVYLINKSTLKFITFSGKKVDKRYGTLDYQGKKITLIQNFSDIGLALNQKTAIKEFQNYKSFTKQDVKLVDYEKSPQIDSSSPSFHRSLDKYIIKSLGGLKDFLLTTRILQDKLGNKFIDPGAKTMHTYKLCRGRYQKIKDEIVQSAFNSAEFELSQIIKVPKKKKKK
jgi:hypothetical protein